MIPRGRAYELNKNCPEFLRNLSSQTSGKSDSDNPDGASAATEFEECFTLVEYGPRPENPDGSPRKPKPTETFTYRGVEFEGLPEKQKVRIRSEIGTMCLMGTPIRIKNPRFGKEVPV